MPAIGAAAAYKRFRAGFEKGEGWGKNVAVMYVLGSNGMHVTAVLANAPGGLQLLPNKFYSKGWLKVAGVGDAPYTVPMLTNNPYADIYAEQTKWWRMINPEWINPAKKMLQQSTSWDAYRDNLYVAENFHDKLKNDYHLQTYAFYGNDEKHKSWGSFTWQKRSWLMQDGFSAIDSQATEMRIMKEGFAAEIIELGDLDPTGAATNNDAIAGLEKSKIKGSKLVFKVGEPQNKGDGTVPEESGAAPARLGGANVKKVFAIAGFEHQNAYATEHTNVYEVMQYSLCKIVQEAT